jgi:hypothetical protein
MERYEYGGTREVGGYRTLIEADIAVSIPEELD